MQINRCARFTWRLIQFCNDNDIYLDCHYIMYDIDDFYDGVEALSEQGNEEWDVPERLTCLELAAVPSAKDGDNTNTFWWNTLVSSKTNFEWTSTFFDDPAPATNDLPANIDSWEPDWQDYWLVDENTKDGKYNLEEDFPLPEFTELAARGYLLTCFPCRQNTGEATVARTLDMSAIYADKLKQENSPAFVSRWRDAFEDAADYFQITDPNPWNPHPNACPTTPCPPCEEN